VDVAAMTADLEQASDRSLWKAIGRRTPSGKPEARRIVLRQGDRPPSGMRGRDVEASHRTKVYERFPAIGRWIEAFAADIDGELGRAAIWSLGPRGHMSRRRSRGAYYRTRDRYHLVLTSIAGTLVRCGNEVLRFGEGELWWIDDKEFHEIVNESSQPAIHVVFDVRPRVKHLQAVAKGLRVEQMRAEVQPFAPLVRSQRGRREGGSRNAVRRVRLRRAARQAGGVRTRDVHESSRTNLYARFPRVCGWVEWFVDNVGGELGRLAILAIPPEARMPKRRDKGEYFRIRDRYYLVLQSADGLPMQCGDEEARMQEGELWWLDNKELYEIRNDSRRPAVVVVFDVLPDLARRRGLPPNLGPQGDRLIEHFALRTALRSAV
jgi:hypothetical protein